jgi:hypothetical protein
LVIMKTFTKMFRPARYKDLSRCAGVSVGRNKTGVAYVGRWSSKAFRNVYSVAKRPGIQDSNKLMRLGSLSW